ncbi:hypothetical protein WJ07_12370 [Burkholderia vietnamiensis]|nr:hypothetical protein WJ07_12370 [Burkholderia vietnamiensis]
MAGNFRQDKQYNDDGTLKGAATDSVAWLELYNKQNVAVNLKNYVLRTGGIKQSDPSSVSASVDYALPDVTIPANGYVVIAGRKSPYLKNSTVNDAGKVVYLLDATGAYLPYWSNSSGFIELQAAKTADAAAKTVDFVRFGTSTTAPLTENYWVGANVPAFATPAATYVGSQSLDPLDTHDQSIVRLNSKFTVTGTSTDWTLVDFPTPGGPNDVAAGVTDSDHDGIPDTAKAAGGTYAGLDLYAMGARPGQKDMFIQLDYMGNDASAATQDSARQLQEASLTKMAAAFARHHFVVHFDAGTRFSAKVDAAHYDLDGANHERTFGKCVQMSATGSRLALDNGCTSIYEYYSQYVDPRRRAFFRYGLFASSQNSNGSSGPSGIAELPGNKVLVTLSGFVPNNLNANGETMRVNFQAATLMHEFGHTLGLRHGGDELAVNYKPNYFSIMNYLYQLSGVPTDGTGTDAIERYYYRKNGWDNVTVPNTRLPSAPYAAGQYPVEAVPHGPTSNTFKIDYSDGSSLNLDENALKESDYVGRGAGTSATAFGDWNLDGVMQATPYRLSLTVQSVNQGLPVYASLHDFNDWNHLELVTGKNYNPVGIAQSYGIGTDHPPLIKTARIQPEEAVPAAVLAHLKQVSAR